MVVEKIIKLVDKFTPKKLTLKRKHGYFLEIYECPVNIVYLLGNKVYLGEGEITGEKKELSRQLLSNSCRGVKFSYGPRLICELDSTEKQIFLNLLKHEKKVFGNVVITSSYKTWLKNDIPNQLARCNDEVYYTYEFRSAYYYETKDKKVYVTLFFDNYDIEEFANYFINDSLENVQKDLDDWAYYEGKIGYSLDNLDRRTIQI